MGHVFLNAGGNNFCNHKYGPADIYVASSGNVTDEVIMKCIEEQGKEPPDDNFKITE